MAERRAVVMAFSGFESVPKERAGHFAILKNPAFGFDGWSGYVESAVPIQGGALVGVRVSPLMHATPGASATVFDYVHEHYFVNVYGFAPHYLGTTEPPGGPSRGYVTD